MKNLLISCAVAALTVVAVITVAGAHRPPPCPSPGSTDVPKTPPVKVRAHRKLFAWAPPTCPTRRVCCPKGDGECYCC